MMFRRDFLATLTIGALAVPAEISALKSVIKPKGVRIGCQTNAWRINPANFDEVLSVLHKLRELGYDGFETGFRNVQGQFENAVEARKKIHATGLTFLGVHIFLDKYDDNTQIAPQELIQKVADGAARLGAQHLILSGGGLIKGGAIDAAALRRKTDALIGAARYCSQQGLRLAYHNHGPEFQNNGLEIKSLYRQTDPAQVSFLMDCGWAAKGGINVPEFFLTHHQRIAGLHLRDFKGDLQVPLGQGNFPMQQLAAVIEKTKWSGWAINEEERLSGEKPGEAAVAPARETLRKILGR